MGLLLPCKVIVYQGDDDQYWVSFARPTSVFQLIPNPEMNPLAEQVEELICQAFESL